MTDGKDYRRIHTRSGRWITVRKPVQTNNWPAPVERGLLPATEAHFQQVLQTGVAYVAVGLVGLALMAWLNR